MKHQHACAAKRAAKLRRKKERATRIQARELRWLELSGIARDERWPLTSGGSK